MNDARAGAVRGRFARTLPILPVLLAEAILWLGFGALLPVLPLYLSEQGIDIATLGWIVAAWPAARLLGEPLFGWLADRGDKRLLMLGGLLATAVVVGGIFTIFEVIVYASLISAMPRAGGDYVWQSRILGRGLGFLLAVTGWWFILWLWVPLYGQILSYEFLTPMAALLGAPATAVWFSGTSEGLLLGMALVCVIVFIYIAVGMKWYARFQKLCFYMGMIGLGLVFILLLTGNKESFIAGLNANLPALYGVPPGDYYTATIAAGTEAGATFAPLGTLASAQASP